MRGLHHLVGGERKRVSLGLGPMILLVLLAPVPPAAERWQTIGVRVQTLAALERRAEGWSYDPVRRSVWVEFPDGGQAVTIVVR